MTVADTPTSHESLAAQARTRVGVGAMRTPPKGPIIPKPTGDMADLLVMSTVDQKVPAEASGGAELLDTLVQEGAAADGRDAASEASLAAEEIAAEAELLAARQPDTPAPSTEQSINLLQREIDMLLRDTPEIAPEAGAAEASETATAPEAETSRGQDGMSETAPTAAAAQTADVSAAELDALLNNAADEIAAESDAKEEPAGTPESGGGGAQGGATSAPVAPTPVPAEATSAAGATMESGPLKSAEAVREGASSATSISEQIFAEQLDRLMASSSATGAMPDHEEKLSEAEGVLAEELAQLISEGAPEAAANVPGEKVAGANAAPSPGAAAESPAASAAAAPAESVLESGAIAQEMTTSAPEAPAAEDAAASAAPAEKASGVRRFGEGVALMVLQLIDLPFGWINELDKNVIGVAAFLLLVGGIVLYVMSRYMS